MSGRLGRIFYEKTRRIYREVFVAGSNVAIIPPVKKAVRQLKTKGRGSFMRFHEEEVMSTICHFRRLTVLAAFAVFSITATLISFSSAEAQTPVLDIHPDTLRFYADFCNGTPLPGDTVHRTFTVSNIGGGSMSWAGAAGQSWAVFGPTEGGNFDSVMVWVDWSQTPVIFTPPMPGDTMLFETQITITAPGAADSPRALVVQLGYICEPENYMLMAQPSHFQLTIAQDDTLAQWLYVAEAHNANIEFYLSNSSNWLILPETFAPLVTPDSVQFMISSGGLAPGVYYDTIVIAASIEPANTVAVPVVLTVSGGDYQLASDPASFNFTVEEGVPILAESLYVYEVHGHSINFWTYNHAYWLYVDTMAASPLYTPDLIFLNIYADTLGPGTYVDTVFIYAAETNDYLAVPVVVTIEGQNPEHEIATEPHYFNLHMPPDDFLDTSLSVYETHGQSIGFIATDGAPWLQISGGPLFTTPVDLDLQISTSGLTSGFYADTVFIFPDTDSYSFPPVAVPVYLQITGETAVVRTSPESFYFSLMPGDSIADVSLFVYEEHGDSLPYAFSVVGESSWLHLPLNLTLGLTPDSLHFAIYTDSLPPGTYGDSLLIYYPYDDIYGFTDVIVPILLTIEGNQPGYHLATNPNSFNFTVESGGIAFDTLQVYDDYGHQIEFFYQSAAPWLVVNPLGMPPYATPMFLPVIANAGGLEPGLYIDTIFVWSLTNDSLPPQTLSVPAYLTVTGHYTCGDANGDESVNIGDAVCLVNYIFRDGAEPVSLEAADANCDGTVNVGDAVNIISFAFRGGAPPGCY